MYVKKYLLQEFIEKHIDKPWDWGKFGLSNNLSITPQFIEKHIDKPCGVGVNMDYQ
jgi:hypothetical protein